MAKDLVVKVGANISDFEKKMAGMSAKMQEIGKKMQDVGKSMSMYVTAPIVAMGAASVMAFNKQEAAEKKLRAALQANGRTVDITFAKYKSFASEMQRLTVVGDEVTLEMLQVAESMGLTGDAAMRAVKNSISMQEAFGVNAQAAIRMTSALEQGDATMLTRYIPALRGVEDQTERAALAQDILSKSFNIATENAKTGQGAMIQMKNAVGDLMEQFGGIISEAITPFVVKIKELAERFQNLDDRTKKIIVVVAGLAAAIGPLLIGLGFLVSTIIPAMIAGGIAISSAWLPLTAIILGVAAAVAIFTSKARRVNEEISNLADNNTLEELEQQYEDLNNRINGTVKAQEKLTESTEKVHEGMLTVSAGTTVATTTGDEYMEVVEGQSEKLEYLRKAIELKKKEQEKANTIEDEYKDILGELNAAVGQQVEGTNKLAQANIDLTDALKNRNAELAEMARFGRETMKGGEEDDVFEPDVDGFVNYYMERMQALANFTKEIMMDAAATIGEALGAAFSGQGFDMNRILKMFGSWAMKLGSILVASAKALQAFKAAILSNPAFAIPFGLALIAAGAAVSAAASSNPMSSGGGGGESYGGGGGRGGTIEGMRDWSQLRVIVSGELRGDGSDLKAVIDSENIRQGL